MSVEAAKVMQVVGVVRAGKTASRDPLTIFHF